jgi:hypothetical protein
VTKPSRMSVRNPLITACSRSAVHNASRPFTVGMCKKL